MSGKGDTPRPYSVDDDTFAANWAAIFGDKAKSIPNKVGKDNGESESESAAEVTGPA